MLLFLIKKTAIRLQILGGGVHKNFTLYNKGGDKANNDICDNGGRGEGGKETQKCA